MNASVRYMVSDVDRSVAFYRDVLGFTLDQQMGVEVGDLEAVVANARAAGATFRNDVIMGPGDQQIVLDDPDGNPIELFMARR